MNGLQLILVIVGAIAVTAYARRREAQPALVITVVALAASFIPGIPRLELESEVILTVVLPPLLYSAALSFSVAAFMRKLGPILVLGVALVVVTAGVVAVVGAWVVPGLTLGAALVLGAVLAPPDAVSAVAIGRELGVRRRVLSVLTGESLVNDAAALTLFSVAVAAVTDSHTFISSAPLLFAYSAAVGIAVGLVVALVTLGIRRALRDSGLETVLGLLVPFAAFLLAEELEASGVLAVVTAGFLIGTFSVLFGYETRLQERQVWSALDVLLEAFVFAYMGLQLRFVIDDLRDAGESVWEVFGAGAVVLVAAMLVRPLWVFLVYGTGLLKDRREPLTQDELVVVSWTGMRGVVTLAAAAGVPAALDAGPKIQAIAFLVAIGTLLVQGATLPWLIRRTGVAEHDEAALRAEETRAATRIAHDAAAEVYARFVASPPPGVSPEFVARAAERIDRRREATASDPSLQGATAEAFGTLTREVVAAQRMAVLQALRRDELDDEAVREFLDQLDVQEAALESRFRNRL